jgi:hypothetical protein
LVAEAKKIARQTDSWIALSNALCDQRNGLIARYFADVQQRREFLKSAEYEQLNELLRDRLAHAGLSPRRSRRKTISAR